MDLIEEGKHVFDIEIKALNDVKDSLGDSFISILKAIVECDGKVIITGMGKPGHVARKIAATMASLGTPAFFLHPGEALHGDLGMISRDDVVMAISYSGESDEITRILGNIRTIGAKLIGISGNPDSTLIRYSDLYYIFPKFDEACHMGLAPTSSTTAALVFGDALAVVASKVYGFTEANFGLFHPAGALGKKLIVTLKDVMSSGENNACVQSGSDLKSSIIEMGRKGLGIVNVVNDKNIVLGVITDGDLRRQLEKGIDIYSLKVNDVMTVKPTLFSETMLAAEALKILKEKNISCAPVLDENGILAGSVRIRDILNKGIA